jgi:hypothetical protein
MQPFGSSPFRAAALLLLLNGLFNPSSSSLLAATPNGNDATASAKGAPL